MQAELRGELVRMVDSEEDPTGDVVLIEPNGDRHLVRCTARVEGTRLTGDGEMIDYLNARYGDKAVCFTARELVLEAFKGGLSDRP